MSTIGALARPLSRGGLTLWVCCTLHLVNDACFALLFPLLPVIAGDLDLSLAEAGLVKTAFSTASSVLQVPAGMLAERWGEYALLVGGNAWVAAGLVAMGLAGAFVPLLGLAVAGGLGGNFQHPLAMSLVTRTAPEQGRGTVVGTLNLAGDVGKVAAPLLVLFVAAPYGWRPALIGLGVFGLLFSAAISRLPVEDGRQPRPARAPARRSEQAPSPRTGQVPADRAQPGPRVTEREAGRWGMLEPGRFATFALVGMLDGSTRSGALAFLPFLLVERGLDPQGVSLLFSMLFVGGAAGKFACGPLADRYGTTAAVVATEAVTCAMLLLLPIAPLLAIPLLIGVFGIVLNGTSSVLYAGVADFFPAARRARGYGVYYTLAQTSAALAPLAYGLLGDRAGLTTLFITLAGLNALTLPLVRLSRRG